MDNEDNDKNIKDTLKWIHKDIIDFISLLTSTSNALLAREICQCAKYNAKTNTFDLREFFKTANLNHCQELLAIETTDFLKYIIESSRRYIKKRDRSFALDLIANHFEDLTYWIYTPQLSTLGKIAACEECGVHLEGDIEITDPILSECYVKIRDIVYYIGRDIVELDKRKKERDLMFASIDYKEEEE